jgi:hypothetical protein
MFYRGVFIDSISTVVEVYCLTTPPIQPPRRVFWDELPPERLAVDEYLFPNVRIYPYRYWQWYGFLGEVEVMLTSSAPWIAETWGNAIFGVSPGRAEIIASLYYRGRFVDSVSAFVEVYDPNVPQPSPAPPPPPPPPEGDATLTVSTVFAEPGDSVQVQLRVRNNPGFASMATQIEFDADVLTLMGYASPDWAKYQRWGINRDLANETGFVHAVWTTINVRNFYQNGAILILTFDVCPAAPRGIHPISVTFANLIDEEIPTNASLQPVYFEITNGKVNTLPAIPGDANGDGRVTSLDANVMARYIIGDYVTIDHRAADLDGDGRTAIADITLLLRALVGLHSLS